MKVIQLIDSLSGSLVTYKETTKFFDGSEMTMEKLDNYVYRYKSGAFYVKTFDKNQNIYLIKNNVEELRNISKSEMYLLKLGYFKGVELLGYYVPFDTKEPLKYRIASVGVDDSGSTFVVLGGQLILKNDFNGVADVSYYGGLKNAKKSENKVLTISTEIDLQGQTIDVSGKTLKFERGGLLKNGILNCNQVQIDSERFSIFDYETLTINGALISVNGWAFPEWWGLEINNSEYDLADYINKLDQNFVSISLGDGYYYSKKGEISIKNLKGVSKRKTFVEFLPEKNNTYLFTLGIPSGTFEQRVFDWRSIKDLYIFINPVARRKGISGIVVGAVHKPEISNINISANEHNVRLTQAEQSVFVDNPKVGVLSANVGVEFRGDSELTNISNLFTLCDIGIKFTEYTDFVQCYDFMNWAKSTGVCGVYFSEAAVQSQNITFAGIQSYNEGLFGVYVEDSQRWNILRNMIFDGVRVEQLNGNVVRAGKSVAYSFRIGASKMITGAIFRSCMCAGSGNLFYVGETSRGSLSIDGLWSQIAVEYPLDCSLNFTFGNEDLKDFKIYLRDVNIYRSKPNKIQNGIKLDMSGNADTLDTIVNSVYKSA